MTEKCDGVARISLLGEVNRVSPVDNLKRRGAAIAGFGTDSWCNWQRTLAEELPPRVQSLGTTQFVEKLKKSFRLSHNQSTGLRPGPGRWSSHMGYGAAVYGWGKGSGVFSTCVRRDINGKLRNSIGRELMNFQMESFQNFSHERMNWHPKSILEEFKKNNGFAILRFGNKTRSRRTSRFPRAKL
ncbi:hypothetical protein EJB05_44552, partial [Eragrostis curvula]